jgi:hypothetical protein
MFRHFPWRGVRLPLLAMTTSSEDARGPSARRRGSGTFPALLLGYAAALGALRPQAAGVARCHPGHAAVHRPGLVTPLQLRLRGGGRRRVARGETRMKLGHLSKVVAKRASTIARRQKQAAHDNEHYGKADSVWEVLNPEELKTIRREEKEGMKEAKRRVARKMAQNPGVDVSSEEVDGRRVIVDYGDVDRAKRELAAAAALEEDRDEDIPEDLIPTAAAAGAAAGEAPPRAARASGHGSGTFEEGASGEQRAGGGKVLPPHGALVYPVGSSTTLYTAIERLRDNQTLWLEEGRHKWRQDRKSAKEQAVEYEDQRMRSLTDWEYEPFDDRMAGRVMYDDYRKTYYPLHALLPTHLPSIFSATTWREILPRIEGIDRNRFLRLERKNLHVRGAPAPNASRQFPLR